MRDHLNVRNLQMLVLYIFVFFLCIAVVIIVGVIFAPPQSIVSTFYDRPPAMQCFHDHRL